MANCGKCEYEWISRVDNPKACPRCKTRLDYEEVAGRTSAIFEDV